MDLAAIIAEAKRLESIDAEFTAMPFYRNTIAMLAHVKLLWNNRIAPRDVTVEITDIIRAGTFEPRIFEVLPALILNYPHSVDPTVIPDDLAEVLRDINAGVTPSVFRGVKPEKYMVWVKLHAEKNKQQHAG